MTLHRLVPSTAADTPPAAIASTASTLPSTATALAALVATAAFVAVVWERREAPTAKPLLGVALTLFVCPLTYVSLYVLVPLWTGSDSVLGVATVDLWFALVLSAVILGTGFWFLFAIEYTGRGRTLLRLVFAGVAAFWVLFLGGGILLAVTGVGERPPTTNVLGVLTTGLFFISALGVVGALLVLETALERTAVRLPEAATLAVGALTFVFAPAAAGNLERPALLNPLLIVASGAFVVTLRRYPIFETLPAARITGRDRLFDAMADAVVVVDRAGRIVDLNPAAADAFGTDRASALDRPVRDLGPEGVDPAEVVAAETPVTVRTGTGEWLSFSGDRVTDDHGRTFGSLLVGRTVTERRRRERRLGVLSHLLTEELREWSDAVADGAASMSTGTATDPTTVAADIRTRTKGMQDLVARVREIEASLADGDGGRTDLSTLVPELVGETGTVRTPRKPVEAAVDESVVRTALDSLLEAASSRRDSDGREEGGQRSASALTVDVISSPPNAEIHVVGERSTDADSKPPTGSTDRDSTPSQAGRDATTAPADETAAVTIARVAVEAAGGSVSVTRTDAGTVRIVVRFPAVDDGSETAASAPLEGGEPR